jgi:hypothetical protein
MVPPAAAMALKLCLHTQQQWHFHAGAVGAGGNLCCFVLSRTPVVSPLYCCRICGVQYLLPADRCTRCLLPLSILVEEQCTENAMRLPRRADCRGVRANVAVQC